METWRGAEAGRRWRRGGGRRWAEGRARAARQQSDTKESTSEAMKSGGREQPGKQSDTKESTSEKMKGSAGASSPASTERHDKRWAARLSMSMD